MSIETLKDSDTIAAEFALQVNKYIGEKFISPPLAYIHTFGCQQNVSDSERIRGILVSLGYGHTEDINNADLILFNTCAIREGAETKIFGNVGELKRLKAEKPDMIIGLCGCMIQQEHIVEKIKKSYPFVTLIFGTQVIHNLPQLMYSALIENAKVISTTQDNGKIAENLPTHRQDRVRGNLPIMQGCDNYCTYCIVPYVRGRERSRESAQIIKEAKELISQGYKEIMLLGQNVNSYGKGLEEDINFSQLLEMINDLEGDFIIRFMTSHPKDCTKELIDTIARCPKVCRQVHLPVQSGNNEILAKMNRKYTVEQYLELINYAKETVEDITFTSDIIVGFPGEDYNQFLDTLSLIEQVGYTQLFTFIYSPRQGTKAAEYIDNIPHKEKTTWMNSLIAKQLEITTAFNKSLIGKELMVLIDGTKRSDSSVLIGRTAHSILVEVEGDTSLIGNYVKVLVTQAKGSGIKAELI